MGGWISAASIPRAFDMFQLWEDYYAARTAYLVIVVAAFVFSILVFMVNFVNLIRIEAYEANVKKWSIVVSKNG